MPSLRARLVEIVLPLLGIKKFFSQPDQMDRRIAKARLQAPERPKAKWSKRFDIREFSSRGFPVITIEPKGGARPGAPHLMYLHGGGYVLDIAAVHWDSICKLCERLGASATVPVYRLAPEAKAVETLGAMRSIYDEVAGRYGARNVTIMGDSAGGGMTLALAQWLAADGAEMPASLVLYSPWLDATASGEGQKAIEPKDAMLAVSGLEACGRRYAGDLPLDDHRVSPLFGSLAGLPPMAIFAGTHDILLVDARRMVEKLETAGQPPHIYREYERMFHVWMLFPIPEGMKALDETAAFISEQREELA